jgi:hypothetical protein
MKALPSFICFLFLFIPLFSSAKKSLVERVNDCIEYKEKIHESIKVLIFEAKTIRNIHYQDNDSPYDILKRDIQKVKKGLEKLLEKTENHLYYYEYYIDQLEFEYDDVIGSVTNASKYHRKGIRFIDEAAFEDYSKNIDSAIIEFTKVEEEINAYETNLIKLKEVLIRMMK